MNGKKGQYKKRRFIYKNSYLKILTFAYVNDIKANVENF